MELSQQLAPLREKIHALDQELISLFLQRMAVAEEIAKVKQQYHAPILDAGREKAVIAYALEAVAPCYHSEVTAFLEQMITLSKQRQQQVFSTTQEKPLQSKSL